MMSLPLVRIAVAVAVLLLAAVPVADAVPRGGSGDDSAELCALLSPDLVEQATELSPPKKVKKAIKTLAKYVEKNCTDGATDGSADSEGESATGIDACALVTQADAEALARTPLDPGVAGPAENDTATCLYAGPVTGPTAQVEFYAGPGVKKALDIARDLGQPLTPVADLGDEAYVYAEDGQIFWFQDGTWYSIRLVLLNDPAENVQPLETLARQVSAKL